MRSLTKLCVSALLATAVLAPPSFVAAQKTINLKFHSSFGKSPLNMAPRGWMDEVEKRTNGIDQQADRDWLWNLKIEEAMGQNLYRYQLEVRDGADERLHVRLAAFFVSRP